MVLVVLHVLVSRVYCSSLLFWSVNLVSAQSGFIFPCFIRLVVERFMMVMVLFRFLFTRFSVLVLVLYFQLVFHHGVVVFSSSPVWLLR